MEIKDKIREAKNTEYKAKLDKAIDDVENKRNLIEYTGEEFKALISKLRAMQIQKTKK